MTTHTAAYLLFCALPLATAVITIAADWFDAWLEKRLTFTIPAVGEVRS